MLPKVNKGKAAAPIAQNKMMKKKTRRRRAPSPAASFVTVTTPSLSETARWLL